MVGNRIVVTGMAGAGKSTFSRVLSTKTGLPVIHLDFHSWNLGWVPVPEGEFLEKQRACLLVRDGLLTAITSTTTSWSSAQTHSWSSTLLGGSVRGVRSDADFGDLAIVSCQTVVMNRSRNGSETNGE